MSLATFRLERRAQDLRLGARVIIDRERQLFTVRPFKKKDAYTLPLEVVAAVVVAKCVKADVAETLRLKAGRRKTLVLKGKGKV